MANVMFFILSISMKFILLLKFQAYRLPRTGNVQIYITPILRQQQREAGSSRDLKPCPPVK